MQLPSLPVCNYQILPHQPLLISEGDFQELISSFISLGALISDGRKWNEKKKIEKFVRRTEEFKSKKTNEKSKSVEITNSPPAPPPAAAPLVAAPFALVSLNQLRTMNKKMIALVLVAVSTNDRWMGHVLESMVGTTGEELDNFFVTERE